MEYDQRPVPLFYPHAYGEYYEDHCDMVDHTLEGSAFTHQSHVQHYKPFYSHGLTMAGWLLKSSKWSEGLLKREGAMQLALAYDLEAEALHDELFDIWRCSNHPNVSLLALFVNKAIKTLRPWPNVSTMLQRFRLAHGSVSSSVVQALRLGP
jgi:hypothetical protein